MGKVTGLGRNTGPDMRWGLLNHLLFLQGDRWAQHHQVLHEHLFCLLHQQDQGLPGGQQDPENQHKEKQGESSLVLGQALAPQFRKWPWKCSRAGAPEEEGPYGKGKVAQEREMV